MVQTRSVVPQRRVGSDFISAFTSIQLQPEERRQNRGTWRDEVEALCDFKSFKNLKWVLWACAATLFFISSILVSVHDGGLAGVDGEEGHMESSSTQGQGRQRRMRLWLSVPAYTQGVRKCLRGPLVQDAIICLQRLLPWEPGYFHAPSPPALRFLCLIVWWPIPWPPGPEKVR